MLPAADKTSRGGPLRGTVATTRGPEGVVVVVVVEVVEVVEVVVVVGNSVVEVVGATEVVVVVELPGGTTAGAHAATRSPQANTATTHRPLTRRISGSSPKDF